MTDEFERSITLRLEGCEIVRAAAVAGHVIGEGQTGSLMSAMTWDAPLRLFVESMVRLGIRKAIRESYDRRFPYRLDDDDYAWVWPDDAEAITFSGDSERPDHER